MHPRFKRLGLFLAATTVFVGTAWHMASANAPASEGPFLAANNVAMNTMMAGMAIKPTGEIDHDFVAMMVPHHQGAIAMAQTELLYGHNPLLLRIAQTIIAEQLQEIAAMRLAIGEPASPTWVVDTSNKSSQKDLPKAKPNLVAERPYLQQTNAAMDKMMSDMSVQPTGNVDHDFVAMMVPHHQGAIDMAKAELRYGSNPQLKTVAQEIVVDQTQEIILMRLALNEPLPPDQSAPTQFPAGAAPKAASGQTQMQMSPTMHMSPTTSKNSN
jgi:uncharacterized protein (DUF305 family)